MTEPCRLPTRNETGGTRHSLATGESVRGLKIQGLLVGAFYFLQSSREKKAAGSDQGIVGQEGFQQRAGGFGVGVGGGMVLTVFLVLLGSGCGPWQP